MNVQSLQPQSPTDDQEELPACQSCRKRKLKCSRELPACSQCCRLSCPCTYAHKKQKPGIRSGAVESLSRRLETLERFVLNGHAQPDSRAGPHDGRGCLYHAALLIANEFETQSTGVKRGRGETDTDEHVSQRRRLNCEEPLPRTNVHSSMTNGFPNREQQNSQDSMPTYDRPEAAVSLLPRRDILDAIIDVYFAKVHHWIPFIHQRRFRVRLQSQSELEKLAVLLHAIIVSAIRQVDSPEFPLDHEAMQQQIRVSRNVVMLNAMNSLSIENLQSLALVAFDHMGSANFPRAWALVGSLVRSVDYLQLTMEPENRPRDSLMHPLSLLQPTRSPGELEDRRRVFWNIFLLDRFCSVTSGWNAGLTAHDVHRRLPANGKIWALEERAVTPFFGILDKSTAKIGNLMSYISGPRSASSDDAHLQPTSPSASKAIDTLNVGALAFRIEATESLNQVTSFFLQQEVDFRNRDEVSKWLARFKELDLRLVHWKLFFPERWGDSSVSKEQTPIEMDPNLTLAHLTHNTSMILLHQHIAYPSPDLTKHTKIPSSCSAETCQLAAVEIASITGRFLSHISYLVSAQFAFCAFVAARILLVHWRFYNTDLNAEFTDLIRYLQEISRRWQGRQYSPGQDGRPDDLDTAARYAFELQSLHDKCLADPSFCTQILLQPFASVCADTDVQTIRHPDTGLFAGREVDHPSPHSNGQPSPSVSHASNARRFSKQADRLSMGNSFAASNTVTSPEKYSYNHTGQGAAIDTGRANYDNDVSGDELTTMSHTLLGQQFAEMDRVFTLNGTDFAFDMGGWNVSGYNASG